MVTSSEIVVIGFEEITKILQFEMHNEMSMHPRARLVCEVSHTFRLQELAQRDIQIHVERRDTQETLFTGYVDNASLEEQQQGYYILNVGLLGGSILLDQEKKWRSFQDVNQKHEDIIEVVMADTPEVSLKCELIGDKTIDKPLIQFQESNWEFVKRVASRINEPVLVDETATVPYIHVGRKSGSCLNRCVNARLISEGMSARFYRLGELAKNNGRASYYYYKVAGIENYSLGEQVVYNGIELYVCEKEVRIEQEELVYTYTLSRNKYMEVPLLYNSKLTGASILGQIKKVSGETMELKLHLKDEAESSIRYAYDWRPEVGNLMYCMPKEDTIVSLYFPSHDEQDAYAVNCVRKVSQEKEAIFEETTKTFLTENGKLMAMASSALHLCAVNQEDESGYAQLSMIDTTQDVVNNTDTDVVSEPEVEIEDIVENMGVMLAGKHDIHLVGTRICLRGVYVDLFAGGKISLMTGAEEDNSSANASVELSAAYFSMTANEEVLFALTGRIGDNTFFVIWDEPKTVANTGELIGNVIAGVVLVAAVAVFCLCALPALLGAVGVAVGTASAIAMGAAVGAAATGAFAIVEQTQKDIENGEASSLLDTIKNVGIKSVFGAIEGGFMAIAGAGSIVAEGSRFLCKQTLKNIGKNLLINQAGSFIASSGNVLADATTGDGITTEEVIDYYCEGVINGLFSSAIDIGKDIPWEKIPFVDNAGKWVNQNVINRMKQTVTNTRIYQNVQTQIDNLMKWMKNYGKYYGNYDDYGNVDARLADNIASNELAITQAEHNLDRLSDEITTAGERAANTQQDLDALLNRQADIGDQLSSLTRGVDSETDELIADLIGERHHLNRQQEYFEQRAQSAIHRLNTLTSRQTANRNRVDSLVQDITQDTTTRKVDKWRTFAVCSVLKFIDDRVQDEVKKQEPIASVTEGAKKVGQWMFEE